MAHYQRYLSHYNQAVEAVKNNVKIQAYLQGLQSQMSIFRYLVMPLRRMARYGSLFEDMGKEYDGRFNTTFASVDRVREALRSVVQVLKEILDF